MDVKIDSLAQVKRSKTTFIDNENVYINMEMGS